MDKLQVTKFDGHGDFHVWKFQVQMFLDANGWFSTICGTFPRPDVAGERQMNWYKIEARAKAAIVNSLEVNVVRSVMSLPTARDMWERLSALYESRSKLSISLLLQEFHAYAMTDDIDMVTHIANVESMSQRLSDLGKVVDEAEVIAKLLQLPKRYRHLISAWDNLDEQKQTRENLIPRLLKEEKLEYGLASTVTTASKDSVALSAKVKSQDSRPQATAKKFTGKCHYCQKEGHKKSKCWKLQKDKKAGAGGAATVEGSRSGPPTGSYMGAQVDDGGFLFSAQLSPGVSDDWLADTGAGRHMCKRRDWFSEYVVLTTKVPVLTASGHIIYGVGIGSVPLESFVDGACIAATLTNVLHVPDVQQNLISIGKLTDRGFEARFTGTGLKIMRGTQVVALGVREGEKLYKMKCRVLAERTAHANTVVDEPQTVDVWHERFGHVNYQTIGEAIRHGTVTGLQIQAASSGGSAQSRGLCEACCFGKQARFPIPKSTERAARCGDLVHFDTCGPMSVNSPSGCKYLAVFVDDASGYLMVFPMKGKDDILKVVESVLVEVASAGHRLRFLRSDNAAEYNSSGMTELLNKHLVKHQFSTPFVPAENGRVERQNRTVMESARAMLTASNLPKMLWAEAAKAAAHIRNRVPLKRLEWKTPYEVWHGRKPSVEHLRIWGSTGYVYVEKHKRDKLDPKSERRVLVGYDEKSKSYRMWLPGTRDVKISRDVRFVEAIPKRSVMFDISGSDASEDQAPGVASQSRQFEKRVFSDLNSSTARSPCPKRVEREASRVAKDRIQNIANLERLDDDEWLRTETPLGMAAPMCDYAYCSSECPKTFQEALRSPDAELWKKAADEEYNSIMANETWELVEKPVGANLIKSMWIFRVKVRPDGSERHKARLVAKGCSQKANVDFFDTYSPVTRMTSIRCILALVAANDLEMVQCDVSTAFLYGDLDEDIYLKQPEGYDDNSGRVCKLKRSLYGLRQAPLQWNKKISGVLRQLDLKPCTGDPCVFVRDCDKLIFALFVDDGLCVASSRRVIDEFLDKLQESFKMTRSEVECYIGIEVIRDRESKKIKIHQKTYLKRVLERFNMLDCNPVSTPCAVDQQLRRNVDEEGKFLKAHDVPFRSLIGSLMYAAVGTRPDLAYIVNQLSQFLECPSEAHWICAKRVLRYVKGTLEKGITYSCGEKSNQLVAYSDASWASEVESRKSVSGVCLTLNGGIIGWKSKKQTIVTDSTTYAEYVAAHACSRDIVWLRGLLRELHYNQESPTVLFIDNAAAELLITNPVFHERSKHLDVKFHYVRERFEKGDVTIKHVSSSDQLADFLTKALAIEKFAGMLKRVGLE